MEKNKYVEFRKWVPFWGLLLDSETEVQKFIDQNNKNGWSVVQFQYTRPNFSIGRIILILIVTFITLGFMSYWVGISIVFKKDVNLNDSNNTSTQADTKPETAVKNDEIEELNSLIRNYKGGFFGAKTNKDKIIEITTKLSNNKENAESLLQYYESNFDKDLISDLKSLSSNYSDIKSYVYPFIKLGIIAEEYPHDRIV